MLSESACIVACCNLAGIEDLGGIQRMILSGNWARRSIRFLFGSELACRVARGVKRLCGGCVILQTLKLFGRKMYHRTAEFWARQD